MPILILLLLLSLPASAQSGDNPFRSTAYPLPRFVTTASNEAFVRSGPGKKYPVQWVFKRSGLPVEITLEFDHWRKIRDHEGQEGWMHRSLLSGKRHAIIMSQDTVSMYNKPDKSNRVIALIEPSVIVKIRRCKAVWCRIEASGYHGWVEKENLWGIYADELIED